MEFFEEYEPDTWGIAPAGRDIVCANCSAALDEFEAIWCIWLEIWHEVVWFCDWDCVAVCFVMGYGIGANLHFGQNEPEWDEEV